MSNGEQKISVISPNMEQTQHNPLQVVKFGGTSVGTLQAIRRAIQLVQDIPEGIQRVVVVSAMAGVTDTLMRAIDVSPEGKESAHNFVQMLRDQHEQVLDELVADEEKSGVQQQLDALWEELERLLHGIALIGECSARTRDTILSVGERAFTPLISAVFRSAGESSIAVDARNLIRTDDNYGDAYVDFEASTRIIQTYFQDFPSSQVTVVTGYIASAPDGSTTTLGRSGSDFTATILGSILRARRVVIWTDVDGVLSADPHNVPEAFPLARLSYTEAAEMAYFGARVLHPRTMRPVQRLGIPLLIKNSLNPKAPGTLISNESQSVELRVKAISTIRDVAVIMLEGNGMLGVPGIAARAFVSLADQKINVLMIAQASSEHSICLIVREADADTAVKTLRNVFAGELVKRDVSGIYTIPRCAIVSAVGDRMRHHPGLAGRMFATLGRSRVNVLSIAQGAAETNISAVVRDDEVRRAVRALHEAFPLGRLRTHICLLGPGRVGAHLLQLLASQKENLLERVKLNVRLVGIANSRKMLWNPEGLAFDTAVSDLNQGMPANLNWLLEQLGASRLERIIIVDATASEEVATYYPDFLELGFGVVTANKLANTLDLPFYQRLQKAAKRRGVAFRYETTVGAAIPVISTIKDMVRSGDRVHKIEGVFSGTLAYVFNSLDAGMPFSTIVEQAHAEGWTEPDPADDLSGEDVARKLLILAREIGMEVERKDIHVESLLPSGLKAQSPQELFKELAAVDQQWQKRVNQARSQGQRLRYLARLEGKQLDVSVQAVPDDSPFATASGRGNIIVFTTDRYKDEPLVVQGPGAGLKVTAGGLLMDLIHSAELMP